MSEQPNPQEDLREFARRSLERHEALQASTRREAANNTDASTTRTFVAMDPPKVFANPPAAQRKSKSALPTAAAEAAAASACPFGSLKDVEGGQAIVGGLVVCGDKNINVPDFELSVATDGQWAIQISLSGVEAATDDDGEIFLPNVVTGPSSASMSANAGTDYDDNDNPSSPASPNGTVVLPIGIWTVTDGAGSFAATGCGSFTVGQCAGILNYTRA